MLFIILFGLVQSAVVEFSRESAEQIFNKGQTAIVLFYRNNNTFAYETFSLMNSSILSIYADVNLPLVQKLMKILDIQEFQIPSIKIISAKGPTVDDIVTYTYDDSLDIAKLHEFTKNYTAYEDIHSEIIPSSSIQDGIHIVVGYTYESFIDDDKRITLMFYYDDQCNLCETVYITLLQMLQSLVQLNNIVRSGKSVIKPSRFKIGKINSKNRIRDPIREYPSLRLFVNGSYVNYDGDRTTEGLLQWVSQQ